MKKPFTLACALIMSAGFNMNGLSTWAGPIVHDAEYYILEAQNGEKWAAEDKDLDKKLAELKKTFGAPPNIIHIMWDDTAFGDVGGTKVVMSLYLAARSNVHRISP